jgi:hypothetical protein
MQRIKTPNGDRQLVLVKFRDGKISIRGVELDEAEAAEVMGELFEYFSVPVARRKAGRVSADHSAESEA